MRDPQFADGGVKPDPCHVVPTGDDITLNGVFRSEYEIGFMTPKLTLGIAQCATAGVASLRVNNDVERMLLHASAVP